ncbi:Copine-domain-containing protein [Dunaliella salina]|uniref:Copine-domain-containing protein n=1 Tax=Dunaliella salina TaxID=3046 RepID=A0ABQ7GSI3_DUNSA|nr:Copine-domain-containing protein [Dunaliella salina]|eukprot:KAF5837569.1 Copine-domain-containing protein [Dunaliella salina]
MTQDRSVFSFLPGDQSLHRMGAVLTRYKEITPTVKLAGPTSFAPAIYQAMRIVAAQGNQYHILLIVADGQVTRPVDMKKGQLSIQEKDTMDAITHASNLPLSIIMVGVGDGPWEVMQDFDDALPARRFDNFQFVNFTEILKRRWSDYSQMEAQFALRALMEVPEQYKYIQKLGLMGNSGDVNVRRLISQIRRPLDPPAPPKLTAAQMSGRFDPASIPSFPPQPASGAYPSVGSPSQAPPGAWILQILLLVLR